MKINMLLSGCLLGLLCFTACDSEGNEMNDYTHYVNPLLVQEPWAYSSGCYGSSWHDTAGAGYSY